MRFKSSINRAPRKKTLGTKGQEFCVWLQLKIIADIGIVGMPNAGKSSLLASLTRAKPKIANYPFTTINPNLGVLNFSNKEIILADIPGLIEGAHKGIGLGDKFLRHIERCKVLIHLIDINENNIEFNYSKIRTELLKYDKSLLKKEIVILNKCDLLSDNDILLKERELKKFSKNIKKSRFFQKDITQLKKDLLKYASNNSKIIVIKLGSSTVVDKNGKFKSKWVQTLVADIKKIKK